MTIIEATKDEVITMLSKKIKTFQEVLDTNGVAFIKCPHCKENIRNYEYTKGMIYAFHNIQMELQR